jgi:radical SAM superfamily enzyme YgiQ (UPF0313 family)
MDIIFFNPPRYRNGTHHKFNNALLSLASYLYERDIEVRIVPLNDEHFEETVRAETAKHRPKFAAVSCKWWDTLYSSTRIAALIKSCNPQTVTVSGGYTANFFARDMVANSDFDVVIKGDAEEPLYRLVSGQTPVNCVFKGDREIVPVRKQYVQREADLENICLIDNLEDIVSDVSVLNSYVWTGKGCAETCVYCAANAWNNVQSFGRARQIYRPIELVLREIEILSKYPDAGRITFDFDPVRGHVEESYYLKLFSAMEKKKYNCYFCSWALPSTATIDALAETFNFIELSIDVQCASDRLRKFLGDRRYLKPYYSDLALDDCLAYIDERYDNFIIDLSTLMGLPFEEDEDVRAIKTFSDRLYDKYENLRYPYVSPMNVEPGSLLLRSPDKYDMVLFRKTFDDFLQYTRRSFEDNMNCYQPKVYADGIYHPLGVCTRGDYERGDYFKVYETWKGVQENIDRRSEEKTLSRLRKYKRYALMHAGIQGGVDRPTLARSEVE